MKENWKSVPGLEHIFQVNRKGEIRTITRHTVLANGAVRKFCGRTVGSVASNGYMRVFDKKNEFLVHRLIAKTFIPNPKNKPCVNHKDGNKLNNNVENLEWATYKENNNHASETGLNDMSGENNGRSKLTDSDVIEIIKLAKDRVLTLKEIAKQFRITQAQVSSIVAGRTWKHLNGGKAIILKNKQYKLNDKNVLEIKKLLKEGKISNEDIGRKFNVSKHTIAAIKCGNVWKHVVL